MTTEFEQSADQAANKSGDSFMEPRTIPKLWDVSAFNTQSTPSRNENADPPTEPADLDSGSTFEHSEPDARFDPFPKPRTIPGNWDVSDMV